MKEPRQERQRPSTADIAAAANAEAAETRAGDREVQPREPVTRADAFDDMRLLPDVVTDDLRPRWADIQAGFVDQPRQAVEQADALVADAIRRLAEGFAQARADLEREWDRGEDVSTEDLRLVFRRYRTFFDRLLDV